LPGAGTAPQRGGAEATVDDPHSGANMQTVMHPLAGHNETVSSDFAESATVSRNSTNPLYGELAGGADDPQWGEQAGETNAAPCGETDLQRALGALDGVVAGWTRDLSARELAVEFRRVMQAQPDLIGRRVSSDWIEQRYPLFCASLGVTSGRPPFPTFAKELALLMPKRRQEARRDGKRVQTYTTYLVPDPAAAVVALAEEKRRRA
jgi:hypothetical protein